MSEKIIYFIKLFHSPPEYIERLLCPMLLISRLDHVAGFDQLREEMKHNMFRPECKTAITICHTIFSAWLEVKYSKNDGAHDGRTSGP